MTLALDAGIAQFNVESVPELVVLGEVAAARRLRAPVALRINPDVAAGDPRQDQHRPAPRQVRHRPTIRRSRSTSSRSRLAGIEVVGLHLHIGSQILSLAPFEAAFRRAHRAGRGSCARAGHRVRRLDLGGGLGVRYRGRARARPRRLRRAGARARPPGLDLELVFEPGRCLVAEAGRAAEPGALRQGGCGAALRGAGCRHERSAAAGAVRCLSRRSCRCGEPAAGGAAAAGGRGRARSARSTDVFARARDLPPLAAEDLVVLTGAGAYGAVMASDYNSRPLAAEVLVDGAQLSPWSGRGIEPATRFARRSAAAMAGAAALEPDATG